MKISPVLINTFKYQKQKFNNVPSISFKGAALDSDVFQNSSSFGAIPASDKEVQRLKGKYTQSTYWGINPSLITKYNAPFTEWIAEHIPRRSDLITDYKNGTLEAINEENFSLAQELLHSGLDHLDTMHILKSTNSENLEFARKMCVEACENNRRFDLKKFSADDVSFLLYSVNKTSLPFAEEICARKGDKRFPSSGSSLGEVIKEVNSVNIDFAISMLDDERLNYINIWLILAAIKNEDNLKTAQRLLGKSDFPLDIIPDIVKATNETNSSLSEHMCDSEDFPKELISGILQAINKQNVELAQECIEDKDFPKELIADILQAVNKENVDLAKKCIEDKDFPKELIANILKSINKENVDLAKECIEDKDFPKEFIVGILEAVNEENIELAQKCIKDKDFPMGDLATILNVFEKNNTYFAGREDDFIAACKILNSQKRKCNANPDLYINDSGEKAVKELNGLFEKEYMKLAFLADILGKEALDVAFRQRTDKLKDRLKSLKKYSPDDAQSIKNLSSCKDKEGNPIDAVKKIEVMNLVRAYNINDVTFPKIEPNSILDLDTLKSNLIVKILENFGISSREIQTIPQERLHNWNTDYTYLFSQELKEDDNKIFVDFLRAANLEEFYCYIYNTQNKYGRANAKTIQQFQEAGLNHWNWTNPNPWHKDRFQVIDENTEMLSQISELIEGDINSLRATPAKKFIDKLLSDYVADDKFSVPKELTKGQLTRFVEGIIKQLEPVWNRAQANIKSENESAKRRANNTLTILDHLNQRVEDISKTKDTKTAKSLDLTIKMWDRIPQKDIFQGNYSNCCIAMGGQNSSAMPSYIMSSAYSMIELVDNKTSNVIGNALCYFVKKDDELAFIIDNIEIKNSYKPSDENSIKLREAITNFAAAAIREVTNREYAPIYMGTNYNDVYCKDLESSKEKVEISLIGTPDSKEAYMDAFGGWTNKYKKDKRTLYRLR